VVRKTNEREVLAVGGMKRGKKGKRGDWREGRSAWDYRFHTSEDKALEGAKGRKKKNRKIRLSPSPGGRGKTKEAKGKKERDGAGPFLRLDGGVLEKELLQAVPEPCCWRN